MAAPIIDHNLLTLDYWQDSVTYEGKTVPGGTIGCEALNIPDTLREKLAQASIPLQKIVAAIKENNLTAELLHPAKGSVLHMIQLAKDTPPDSRSYRWTISHGRHFPTQQFNMYLPSAPRKTRRSSCAGCTICLSCLCSAPICTRVYASDTRRGNAWSVGNGF